MVDKLMINKGKETLKSRQRNKAVLTTKNKNTDFSMATMQAHKKQ